MKKYQLSGKMKEYYTVVDDDIYEELVRIKAKVTGRMYPSGSTIRAYISSSTDKSIKNKMNLHRYVYEKKHGVKLTPDQFIDHANNNALTNTAANLRLSNHWDNRVKTPSLLPSNRTGYRGVGVEKKSGKFTLCITVSNKTYFLARSRNKILLARIYDFIYNDIFRIPCYSYNVPNDKIQDIYNFDTEDLTNINIKRIHTFIENFQSIA